MIEKLRILEQKHLITGLQKIVLENTSLEKIIIYEADRIKDKNIWAKTFFVELNEDILSSDFTRFNIDECEKFQSNLLGERFFAEKTALRWNYYLYFIISNDKMFEVIDRDIIESDTQYARKRIVLLDELVDLFKEFDYGNKNDDMMPDPESEWLEILTPHGLSGCLNIAYYTESVNSYIEKDLPIGIINNPPKMMKNISKDDLIPIRIDKLDMIQYRSEVFGDNNTLNFGQINLIEGANGTGKSSIIDAIELALTGSIKRYADTKGKLNKEITSVETYTKTNKISTFSSNGKPSIKERGQIWYNIPNTREYTKISEKFGQINRFSIESVFSLVNSQCRDQDGAIQDSISKLCFGDSLALMQKNWKSYLEYFKTERKKYDLQLSNLKSKKTTDDTHILNLENEIKSRQTDIHQLYTYFFGESFESNDFMEKLEDLYLRTKTEFKVFSTLSQYTSYSTFQTSHLKQKSIVSKLNENINNHENVEKEVELIKQEIVIYNKRERELIQSFEFYSNSHTEITKLRQEILSRNIIEDQIVSDILESKRIHELCITLKTQYQHFFESNAEEVIISQSQLDRKYEEIKTDIANFSIIIQRNKDQESRLKEEKETIIQNLNSIQQLQTELIHHGQALINATKQNSCPLCGQIYDNASALQLKIQELNNLNVIPTKSQLDICTKKLVEIQSILINAQRQQKKLEKEKYVFNSLSDILQKCESIIDIKRCKNINDLRSSIYFLENQMANKLVYLEENQKSIENLKIRFVLTGFIGSNISECEIYSKQKIDVISKELETIREQKVASSQNLLSLEYQIEKNGNIRQSLQNAIHLEKEMNAIQITINNLIMMNVVILQHTDLFLLKNNFSKLEGVIKVIAENSQMKILLDEQEKRKEDILKIEKYLERCNIAINTLNSLKDLEKYSEKHLKSNLQQIAVLFKKLHMPPEFTDLKIVNKEIVIYRSNSSQYIHINQMSMGQRTSLALAILFQMHIMSKDTPRILLLDEPVSNLDDTHIMNMIDVLRELALKGTQIFITTASSEIARYLERKFAFMEQEFVYYQLERRISDEKVEKTVVRKHSTPYLIASGE